MSHRQIFYHIVFGTKDREATITEPHSEELYKYIWGVIKNNNCKLYRINGMEDHIHIFSDLHPSVALADYIKDIKVSSSLWMKANGNFPKFKNWQDGYGTFTYSTKQKDTIINYIKIKKNTIGAKVFMRNTSGCLLKMKLNLMKSICSNYHIQPLPGWRPGRLDLSPGFTRGY